MKISELAKRTNISTHRLRRYEALGLIKSTRSKNSYREFSESVVREAIFISMSRECGFSINSITYKMPRNWATLIINDFVRPKSDLCRHPVFRYLLPKGRQFESAQLGS